MNDLTNRLRKVSKIKRDSALTWPTCQLIEAADRIDKQDAELALTDDLKATISSQLDRIDKLEAALREIAKGDNGVDRAIARKALEDE